MPKQCWHERGRWQINALLMSRGKASAMLCQVIVLALPVIWLGYLAALAALAAHHAVILDFTDIISIRIGHCSFLIMHCQWLLTFWWHCLVRIYFVLLSAVVIWIQVVSFLFFRFWSCLVISFHSTMYSSINLWMSKFEINWGKVENILYKFIMWNPYIKLDVFTL